MLVLGIDPGPSTAIVAVGGSGDPRVVGKEVFADCHWVSICHWIKRWLEYGADPAVVVVEDIIGSGPRSTEIVRTLKVIGRLEGYCGVNGHEVILQAPQKRLAFIEAAKEKLEDTGISYTRAHIVDACAHALAYIYEKGNTEWLKKRDTAT